MIENSVPILLFPTRTETTSLERTFKAGMKIKVAIIRDRKGIRTWSWIITLPNKEAYAGKIKVSRVEPAGRVLMQIADLLCNPSSPNLPDRWWKDSIERRMIWSEVSQDMRFINDQLFGLSIRAN